MTMPEKDDTGKGDGNKDKPEKDKADEPDLSNLPIEPEVLDKLPPEARKRLVEMNSFMALSGPMMPPFLKKINEEHISRVLELSDKDSQRAFEDAQSSKKYTLAYVVCSFLLFGFIIVYLADRNPVLLKDILTVLGIFAGGFGAGFGLKAFQDRSK
jgi:hypothetical protein